MNSVNEDKFYEGEGITSTVIASGSGCPASHLIIADVGEIDHKRDAKVLAIILLGRIPGPTYEYLMQYIKGYENFRYSIDDPTLEEILDSVEFPDDKE